MNTLTAIRRLCGVWLAAVLWLAFQPLPSPAQPESPRTAMKPIGDAPPDAKSLDDGPNRDGPRDAPPGLPTGAGNAQHFIGVPPKALVLHNGRLVEGKISQSGAGYTVDKPNGSILVPFDRVQFTASGRRDAYLKLRATMPARAATSNVVLARWCLTYNLLDEAADELRQALELEPSHQEARTMLMRLDELRNPNRPIHKETPRDPDRTADGFETPPLESLGGLSRKSAQEFTAQIQPMLLNKCGNASCHGGASPREGFALANGRGGRNTRVYAERNLAAAIRYIDFETPDRSELLTAPRGAHAGSKSVFTGPKSGEQIETLRKWVRAAATELRDQRAVDANRPSLASRGTDTPGGKARSVSPDAPIVRVSAETEADENPGDENLIDGNPDDETSRNRKPGDSKSGDSKSRTSSPRPRGLGVKGAGGANGPNEVGGARGAGGATKPSDRLTKTLQEEQPDPFDPAEFNRKPASKKD